MTGRTRWGRFGIALAPAMAAAAGLVVAMASGALAVSFAISGSEFKVSADRLDGTGFEQFPGVDHTAGGDREPVAVSVIGAADLTNLCQTVVIKPVPIPGVDHVTVRIGAGDAGRPVHATNLVVDATVLAGSNVTFNAIQIGRDASTLDAVPGPNGPAGFFGQQAASIVITDLEQTALATTAGTFTLPSFSLALDVNGDECF